ncbi:MAG: cytochrome ubiquinol oxidase subunit I [Nitrospiria bacterium]
MERLARLLAFTLFIGAPGLGVFALNVEAAEPAMSDDVYFKTAGPISGSPAPHLTAADYPVSPFPSPLNESRVIIWVLAQQHLYVGAFILGVLFLVTLSEGWALVSRREEAPWARRAAQEMLRLVILAIAVGALSGALLLAGLWLWYPGLSHYLAAVFRPSVLFYGVLVVSFNLTAIRYYYSWPTEESDRRWDHLALGVFANILGVALVLVANSWSAFMMAPSGIDAQGRFLGSDWAVLNGALSLPLAVHRLSGHIVFGGAVIAAYAAYHALASTSAERKAYYDWMGCAALIVALISLFTIPFGGYWFHREIYGYRQQMGITLLGGLLAWHGIILVTLLAIIIMLITYYFWQRIDAQDGGNRFAHQAKYVFLVLALGLVVYVTPHTLVMRAAQLEAIGGQQHPVVGHFGVESAKQGAVNLMLIATAWSALVWWRSRYRESPSRAQSILAALFLVGSLNIVWLSVGGYFIPANVRVGYQMPIAMTTFSVIVLGAWLTRRIVTRAPRSPFAWGRLPNRGYWALLSLGVTVTWLMGLAGYRRSSVRLFWHAMETVRDTSPWAFTHAIGFAGNVITVNTLLFWLGFAGLAWLSRSSE